MAKRRSNGEGGISFDAVRGSYRAYIVNPEGKRIFKRFKDFEEANIWKTEQLSTMHKGIYVVPSDVTIGDFILTFLASKKQSVSLGTYEFYINISSHLAPLSKLRVQDLNVATIQNLYSKLKTDGKIADSTIYKVHKLLKAILNKAIAYKIIRENPSNAVDSPRFEKKAIEIFSKTDIELILKTCYDRPTLKQKYPMILLAVTTGIRLGELLGVEWCDINFNTQEMFIQRALHQSKSQGLYLGPTKTKSSVRKIKLTAAMIEELHRLKAARKHISMLNDDLIFATKNNTPTSLRNLERFWTSLIKHAGLPHKNFHVLRHTHATELLAAGVPIIEVSRRMGHSKVSHTLDLYGHAIPNYDQHIADKVTQLYAVPKR